MLFALASSKTKELYKAVLEVVLEFAPELLTNLKHVMGDFEKAIVGASIEVLKKLTHGYVFHYKKLIIKSTSLRFCKLNFLKFVFLSIIVNTVLYNRSKFRIINLTQ